MPNASGSVDLSSLSTEENEAIERLAAERGGEVPPPTESHETQKVLTAFVIVVDMDGNPQPMVLPDPRMEMIVQPTPDMIYAFCGVVRKDIASREAALATGEVMQQQAMAMQQQMQNARLAAQVGKDPRGMGVTR